MKNDIVLPSTNKGYISMHVWSIIWSTVLLRVAAWLVTYIDKTRDAGGYLSVEREFAFIAMIVLCGIVVIILICNIVAAIYSARNVVVLSHGNDGFLEKLVVTSYGFPFSINKKQISFNRIVGIEVTQSSIGRILNNGDLALELVTFTNAQTLEESCEISAINDPHGIKSLIEKSLLGHEGLMIKK